MNNISTHITFKEATRSDTAVRLGLKNEPNETQLQAMKLVAAKVFEPLRDRLREPIRVNSFFRTEAVNKAIGGSVTSQHMKGEAMDICATPKANYTNADIFYYIKNNLLFDQLIWEMGDDRNPAWVHVSYSATGNRCQVLRAIKRGEKTGYEYF